jgi:hypothetical protein
MTWLAALASLAVPVLARVLLALGFSVVTITGVAVAIGAVKAQILAALSSGSVNIISLAGLAGAWEALGMVFGSITFAVSFWALTSSTKILGKGGGG